MYICYAEIYEACLNQLLGQYFEFTSRLHSRCNPCPQHSIKVMPLPFKLHCFFSSTHDTLIDKLFLTEICLNVSEFLSRSIRRSLHIFTHRLNHRLSSLTDQLPYSYTFLFDIICLLTLCLLPPVGSVASQLYLTPSLLAFSCHITGSILCVYVA